MTVSPYRLGIKPLAVWVLTGRLARCRGRSNRRQHCKNRDTARHLYHNGHSLDCVSIGLLACCLLIHTIPIGSIPTHPASDKSDSAMSARTIRHCFYAVMGSRTGDGSGAVVLFRSPDAQRWTYVSTLDRSRNQYGTMWECPDFFWLDGVDILIVSPMEMLAEGLEFHNGNNAADTPQTKVKRKCITAATNISILMCRVLIFTVPSYQAGAHPLPGCRHGGHQPADRAGRNPL